MKRKFISTIVGFSVVLLSLVGAPAYGRDGVTDAADTRASAGDTPAVSAAAPVQVELVVATVEPGLAVVVAAYGARHYSSGISTGRYGSYRGYGQRHYAPRSSTGGQVYRFQREIAK